MSDTESNANASANTSPAKATDAKKGKSKQKVAFNLKSRKKFVRMAARHPEWFAAEDYQGSDPEQLKAKEQLEEVKKLHPEWFVPENRDYPTRAKVAKEMKAIETNDEGADKPLNAKERRKLRRKIEQETDPEVAKALQVKLDGAKESVKQEESAVGDKRPREEELEEPKKEKSIHLTLFVGQLPFNATAEDVKKHFAEAGEVTVRLRTNKKTGKSKGMAFIEVADRKALGAALAQHHTLLHGRRINVELTAGGGGSKSEERKEKIRKLRTKQSEVQVKKASALAQKRAKDPDFKLTEDDVDDRMVDFLSWFDYATAKKALDEFETSIGDHVENRRAFFMGILKRFRTTDGKEGKPLRYQTKEG